MVTLPFLSLVAMGAGLTGGLWVFLATKIFQDRQRIGMPVLRILVGAVFCLFIWVFAIMLRPMQMWQRLLAGGSAQYGMFLYYTALKRMFTPRRSRSLVHSPGFWITTLVVIVLMLLDLSLGNQVAFDDTEPYIPSWTFYTEAALGFTFLLCMEIVILQVYRARLQRTARLIERCRLSLCLLGSVISTIGVLLVEINLLLCLAGQQHLRVLINTIYHLSTVLALLFIACGYVLPDRWLFLLMIPFPSWNAIRQHRNQVLLRCLHEAMITIVPGVHLPCEEVRELRVEIEISDARQIIWSQQPRSQPITPREEAAHLLDLLHRQIMLQMPGYYPPAPTRQRNTRQHNMAVARQLARLRGQSHPSSSQALAGAYLPSRRVP